MGEKEKELRAYYSECLEELYRTNFDNLAIDDIISINDSINFALWKLYKAKKKLWSAIWDELDKII